MQQIAAARQKLAAANLKPEENAAANQAQAAGLKSLADAITYLEQQAEQLKQRDERDRGRSESPLMQAPDAIYIDSTGLSPDEVEEAILKVIRTKLSNGKGFQ